MPKTKAQKQKVLDTVNQKIGQSKSIIFSTFEKLPVNDDFALRQELKKEGANHEVVKKTLLNKILADKNITDLKIEDLRGNITVTTSPDEIVGAKILAKFIKNKENFKIIGGMLENKWLNAENIIALSRLPSKDELIAKTIGTIKAPLGGLVNVLAGNLRNLVNVLNALKDKK
ncbi:MAG TPA: 50S ribosomal protein L10 [bacterium]|nr:50S ribosomal protein L10 [bacterium]HPL95346.1 50S ribosomal protein L10 [bacterium]